MVHWRGQSARCPPAPWTRTTAVRPAGSTWLWLKAIRPVAVSIIGILGSTPVIWPRVSVPGLSGPSHTRSGADGKGQNTDRAAARQQDNGAAMRISGGFFRRAGEFGIVVALLLVSAVSARAATECIAEGPGARGSAVALTPITACSSALRECTREAGKPGVCAVVSARATDKTVTASARVRVTVNAASSGQCNVEVCSQVYRSFRASDCTYQPNSGPRRLCTRTSAPPQQQQRSTVQIIRPRKNVEAPSCNVVACRLAYGTFRESDCTYRSFFGQRRVCRK
ncbi:MAG: BA14K family protein [Rhodobiaceae bacterium]|nr:BA14K family protein [Rhodobiaceae bacterium]